jgi:hypothetical protein
MRRPEFFGTDLTESVQFSGTCGNAAHADGLLLEQFYTKIYTNKMALTTRCKHHLNGYTECLMTKTGRNLVAAVPHKA